MATLKVKLRPSTKEGGMGTVIYQVIHNRVARQVATDCRLLPSEWDAVLHAPICNSIHSERNAQLCAMANRIESDTAKLTDIIRQFALSGDAYTADDIILSFRQWQAQDASDGFVRYGQSLIARMQSLGRRSAAKKLRSSLNSFLRFLGADDIPLRNVDAHLMEQYEGWLKTHRLSINSRSFYMRNLRCAYNRAVEDGLVAQNDPFRRVYTGTAKTEKRALTFLQMQAVKQMDLLANPKLDFARSVFLLSFYLRGIAPIDLAFLRKSDLRNGVVIYCRRKTGQRLAIKWERCMQTLLKRLWELSDLREKDSPFLLPIIPISEPQQVLDEETINRLYYNASRVINRSLRQIGSTLSFSHVLTLYVARHSWASIAKNRHIPVSVISEGLGHDNERTTQIYLASLDNGILDAANRKVLRGL